MTKMGIRPGVGVFPSNSRRAKIQKKMANYLGSWPFGDNRFQAGLMVFDLAADVFFLTIQGLFFLLRDMTMVL
jgi:hypothetical protein